MNTVLLNKDPQQFAQSPNLANYDKVRENFRWQDFHQQLTWFNDGGLNAAYNAIDRHLSSSKKDKIALFWEGEDGQKEIFTFSDIYKLSNKFANVLKDYGVQKGDRVFLFLPRIPQLYYCFLSVLKLGAIAGTMFSAFAKDALRDRLDNSQAVMLVTTKELKKRLDEVRDELPALKHVLVVDSPEFERLMKGAQDQFDCANTRAEDYAFMLYTSGTTGKPKGVVHAHYAILHEHLTARWVLDLHDQDIYWCTADPGWVTGIAYEILGTWSCGATTVVYGGRFDTQKWYSILANYKVSVWYTAPTAARMLAAAGDELVSRYDLSQLRHLVSVGEPLNPEVVLWSQKVFGKPFHDTWWQTETGGIMVANYPSLPIKPGSMGKPFPGVNAEIIDDDGQAVATGKEGNLAIKPGWPSMMRTIWQNPPKYYSYFVPPNIQEASQPPEDFKAIGQYWYYSGDRAYKDADGYFWFVGRADDVIKTSGERVGPFEVESALVEHPAVVEAGVIGKPDPVRGEIIKAFVVLKPGIEASDTLKQELVEQVKKHLAGHAHPREIEFIDKLPKTRSGKIMRRILKAKELGQTIGDTSTLEEY